MKRFSCGTRPPAAASTAPAELPAAAARARGRPLSFDRTAALERAMHVFWQHGYEAASIADLTAAMGITPPSLYTAFGDKARLFVEAVEAYANGPGAFGARALAEEPTARGAVKRLLEEAATELTQSSRPHGCMMVTTAMACSVSAEPVQALLATMRAKGIQTMQDRIQRGIDSGELPPEVDAAALANFYATVYQGMSVQAKDGASRESLLASVALAIATWPSHRPAPGHLTPARRRSA